VYWAGAAWSDYRLSVSVASDDDDAVGVLFRYRDSGNYYRFSFDRQRRYRRLVKKVDGQYYLLAEDGFRYAKGQTYQVEAVVRGSVIEVYVDGGLVFSVVDDGVSGGTVGMYCWGNAGAWFDNILVEGL
jgi:hypothetical protein